jgi:hypothetical protein
MLKHEHEVKFPIEFKLGPNNTKSKIIINHTNFRVSERVTFRRKKFTLLIIYKMSNSKLIKLRWETVEKRR